MNVIWEVGEYVRVWRITEGEIENIRDGNDK